MKFPEQLIPPPLRRPGKPGERRSRRGGDGNLKDAPAAAPSTSEQLAERAKEVPADVVGWVDERTGAGSFATGLLYRKVPKGTNWFYTLGSGTLFAFIVQAVTGVFLAMYYTPSPTEAYDSVTHLTNDVWLGEFVRGMHRWGASVMIILIFLHMARTFFFGAYKYPRELNWVIGVVLLILTLTMGLTGYLLPFDQRSFWATIVANNIVGTGPVLGPYLADFLRAGPEIGATTLARFYALHMLVIPGAIIALIGAHLYLVVKLGTTAPPWLRAEKPRAATPAVEIAAGADGAREES
jgi:menaquinol-cytochrome c reductase cytochrome b subunit